MGLIVTPHVALGRLLYLVQEDTWWIGLSFSTRVSMDLERPDQMSWLCTGLEWRHVVLLINHCHWT